MTAVPVHCCGKWTEACRQTLFCYQSVGLQVMIIRACPEQRQRRDKQDTD